MTPNVNYFERIEDYCLDLLEVEAKVEFEAELKLDAELRSEVKLRMEIQAAVAELDITNLRDKLKNVASQSKTSESHKDPFELFTDFSDFQEIHEELNTEDLINFYDSMPKVHVHQHNLALNENIHQFYKSQTESSLEEEIIGMDDIEFEDLEGLEEAILEKDIIEFRQALNQVSKSIEPQFTVEEIDNYMNGELDDEELINFEKELSYNSTLKDEILLHGELESAIKESEIMNLRSQVSQIMETETSWNVSEKDIEDFIDGELSEELLNEFMSELSENSDLNSEVELRKQVNEILGEEDIMSLRKELDAAKEFSDVSEVRRLVPILNKKIIKILRSSAAMLIVLLGLASLLNSGYISVNNAYDNNYESPQWAQERAVSADYTYYLNTQSKYNQADYPGVIKFQSDAPENVRNNPVIQFYTAASMQNLEKYTDAIARYSNVIEQGDNMFIEEAEWYRSLCYLKLGNKNQTRNELLAVVNRNGHYKQNAKAILRRIKYSME